ncbi:hypothetical protein J3E64_004093 [Sphingobium sp. OAS761]|nr:hypothetical protein [Sphingobium sp. OAS761]
MSTSKILRNIPDVTAKTLLEIFKKEHPIEVEN